MDNEKVFLELTRSEALATWEALHAAHRFLGVIDGGDVLGGGVENLERLQRVITRLEDAMAAEGVD
jgi:hypothetical protein